MWRSLEMYKKYVVMLLSVSDSILFLLVNEHKKERKSESGLDLIIIQLFAVIEKIASLFSFLVSIRGVSLHLYIHTYWFALKWVPCPNTLELSLKLSTYLDDWMPKRSTIYSIFFSNSAFKIRNSIRFRMSYINKNTDQWTDHVALSSIR